MLEEIFQTSSCTLQQNILSPSLQLPAASLDSLCIGILSISLYDCLVVFVCILRLCSPGAEALPSYYLAVSFSSATLVTSFHIPSADAHVPE